MILTRNPVWPDTTWEYSQCPRPYSRILTAYHEAGHAVAAAVLEIPFLSVTIIPGDGFSGYLSWVPHGTRITLEEFLKRMVVTESGGRATDMLTNGRHTIEEWQPDGSLRLWGTGNTGDIENNVERIKTLASHYGLECGLEFTFQMLNLYTVASTKLLCSHWPAVIRVAEKLLERKTLTEDEVHELMSPVLSGVAG